MDDKEITIDELDRNNILSEKQIFSLHFNKLDLDIVRDLNSEKENKNYIFLTSVNEVVKKYKYQLISHKYELKNILKLEFGSKLVAENDMSQIDRQNLQKQQNDKYGTTLLFLGETETKQPIFMDKEGYIIDFNGNEYCLSNKFIEKQINYKTYKMFLFSNSLSEEATKSAKQLLSEKGTDDTPIDQREIVQKIIYSNKKNGEELDYEFERLRLGEDQIKQIKLNCFDYSIIKKLNTDTSIARKKYQFGFQSINHMQKAQRGGNLNDYKFCLLVGFTKDIIDGSRKPVYLKYNGWFSDTSSDYWPNYRTIRITKDLLSKTFGNEWKLTHGYLLNQISYEFIWGQETTSAINYNDWFTGNYWTKYVLKLSIVIGLHVPTFIIALASGIGLGAAALAAIASIAISKGLFGIASAAISHTNVGTGGRKTKKRKKMSIKRRRKLQNKSKKVKYTKKRKI